MPASLLKIPLLIIMAFVNHISYQAPHQASSNELVAVVGLPEKIFTTAISLGFMSFWQWTSFLFVLAETIVILLSHLTSSWATATESYLCPSGLLSSTASNHKPIGPGSIAITPSFLVGFAALVFGGLLRAACYQALGSNFTFLVAVRKDHKLITTGPYSYVRHPAYLGGATFFLGFAHAFFARGSYLAQCWSLGWMAEAFVGIGQILIVCPATFTRAVTEDALMKREFGKEWEEWAQTVRYRVIPGIW